MKKTIIIAALIVVAVGLYFYTREAAETPLTPAPAPGETSFSTLPAGN
jgi:hypothetical protein